MEVQKHLFRIAERSHVSPSASICWKIIYMICLIASIIFLSLFAIGQLYLDHNSSYLRRCMNDTQFNMASDQIAVIYELTPQTLKQYLNETYTQGEQPIINQKNISLKPYPIYKESQTCTIYKNLNTTKLDKIMNQNIMLFSYGQTMVNLNAENREKFKVTNYTFFLKQQPGFVTKSLYTYFTMLTRELVELKDEGLLTMRTVTSNLTNDFKLFSKCSTAYLSSYKGHSRTDPNDQTNTLKHHLTQFCKIIYLYALASIVTAFYIYVTIIASPAIILLILGCTPYGRNQQFNQAHKAFPWIGMHSLILKSANNRQVRKNYDQICYGLICYFFCLYLIYYTTIMILSNDFFKMPLQIGVAQVFFGYIAILEFSSLIFMRTRPFLKYFPISHTILVCLFLIYCQQSHFGYKLYLSLALQFIGFTLFSWMVIKLEIPAQTTWDRNANYVPTLNQPRAAFMPAFNLNWINGLPDQWAMLMPLFGRGKFSEQEMAFVDRNYELVNQYLNQRQQRRQ